MADLKERTWRAADGSTRRAWVVRYLDTTGDKATWRLKTFKGTEAEARRDAAKAMPRIMVQIQDGEYQAESTSITLGEAFTLWVARAKAERLERGTVQQYEQHRDRLLELIDRKTKLAKLRRTHCEALRDNLLKHHSRPMAQKLLVSFKSALREARRRGLMSTDPAAETTIGANGRHTRKLRVGVDLPNSDEFRALLRATEGRPKERALLCLAGIAALRASELRGLPWADLALGAEPTVTITQRADKWSTLGSPKSESAQRRIELGKITVQALKEWRIAQPAGRSLVFGTAADRPDLLGNMQRRILDPMQVRAGVTKPKLDKDGQVVRDPKTKEPVITGKYSWHALRHFAITQWIVGGHYDLKDVQYLAGHATLALTLDRYGHFVPKKDAHARASEHEATLLG